MRKKVYKYFNRFKSRSIYNLRQVFLVLGTLITIGIVLYFVNYPNLDKINKDDWGFYIEQFNSFLIEILGTLVTALFVIFIWGKVASDIEDNEKTFVIKEINNALKGLKRIRADKAYEKAAAYVSNSTEIRVIGSISLDHWNDAVRSSIEKYLTATFDRVNSTKLKKYRRISSINIPDDFRRHVEECFKVEHKNFQVMFLEDFSVAYTYLTVDDDFLLLSLNFHDQSSNAREFCYYSENKKIVRDFKNHFTTVWHDELATNKPASKFEEYCRILEYQETAHSYFSEIKKSITKFVAADTYYRNHSLKELQQTASRLTSLSNNELEVNHTTANGFLLKLFCTYTDELKEDDTYITVTFHKFWKEIVERGNREPDFIGRTKDALSRGVKITRLLIVKSEVINWDLSKFTSVDLNSKIINDYEYLFGTNKTIELNYEILKSYPRNYDFKILFSEKHDDYQKDFFNFAIIRKQNQDAEIVLFEPDNTGNIETTKVAFFDATGDHVQMHRIRDRIIDKQKKFEIISKLWEKQMIAKKHMDFIESIIPEILNEPEIFEQMTGKKPPK